jgi:hypothetical protein
MRQLPSSWKLSKRSTAGHRTATLPQEKQLMMGLPQEKQLVMRLPQER